MRATLFGRSISLTVNPSHDGDVYHLSGTSLNIEALHHKLLDAHVNPTVIGESLVLTERYLAALDSGVAKEVLKNLKTATVTIQR